ncbi:MAG: hypothetical protein RMJ17_01120 [Candidatus Aenigmarchaeota archaeon]|nr:hypothetical protein [Candidatus Aenigmarchaeota archaeon]MDW8149186.1 hypothetical protein [Candidatus Aenigmarchaeota archaeon]
MGIFSISINFFFLIHFGGIHFIIEDIITIIKERINIDEVIKLSRIVKYNKTDGKKNAIREKER